jgi:protease I
MTDELKGQTIAFLATEGVEQVELTEPWKAVEQAGGTPELVSPDGGTVQAFNHLDKADRFESDHASAKVAARDFDGLVLPGGVANPDALRTDEASVAFVRGFAEAHKPIAVICHGPWTMVEADIVRGRCMTSWPSVRTDLVNAGADWRDEEVIVCDHVPGVIVSSRKPDDLPAFCKALVEQFALTRAAA